jgi:hypothetical protein
MARWMVYRKQPEVRMEMDGSYPLDTEMARHGDGGKDEKRGRNGGT